MQNPTKTPSRLPTQTPTNFSTAVPTSKPTKQLSKQPTSKSGKASGVKATSKSSKIDKSMHKSIAPKSGKAGITLSSKNSKSSRDDDNYYGKADKYDTIYLSEKDVGKDFNTESNVLILQNVGNVYINTGDDVLHNQQISVDQGRDNSQDGSNYFSNSNSVIQYALDLASSYANLIDPDKGATAFQPSSSNTAEQSENEMTTSSSEKEQVIDLLDCADFFEAMETSGDAAEFAIMMSEENELVRRRELLRGKAHLVDGLRMSTAKSYSIEKHRRVSHSQDAYLLFDH